jgi:hypothetical protein
VPDSAKGTGARPKDGLVDGYVSVGPIEPGRHWGLGICEPRPGAWTPCMVQPSEPPREKGASTRWYASPLPARLSRMGVKETAKAAHSQHVNRK